jgi:hypothetical protein
LHRHQSANRPLTTVTPNPAPRIIIRIQQRQSSDLPSYNNSRNHDYNIYLPEYSAATTRSDIYPFPNSASTGSDSDHHVESINSNINNSESELYSGEHEIVKSASLINYQSSQSQLSGNSTRMTLRSSKRKMESTTSTSNVNNESSAATNTKKKSKVEVDCSSDVEEVKDEKQLKRKFRK